MTAAERRAIADYRRARSDFSRTARDPHSPAHHAALIMAERAAAAYITARAMARSATRAVR